MLALKVTFFSPSLICTIHQPWAKLLTQPNQKKGATNVTKEKALRIPQNVSSNSNASSSILKDAVGTYSCLGRARMG